MKLTSWLLLGLCVVLAALTPVSAQEYRGNLFVEVTKEDNSPVPGAKLTLAGTDFSRVQTADGEGKVRFIRLEPGTYKLTAEADGFAKVVLDGVHVNTLANVSMRVKLTSGTTLEESIVVTATTPLLDQRKTGSSTVLTQAELSEVPTSRDPWAVLSTVPGVTTDRVNVGGNESGQQSNFVGKGDDGTNTSWVMDGVEFTDIGAAGSSATYLDFNSFDEIGFTTGGGDVEQTGGGLRMNFTTKQGTNSTTGNARLWYTTIGLQADVSGLSQPANVTNPTVNPLPNNQINEVFEKNFDIGGPLWKDHIWYWFGFSQNDIDVLIATGSDKTKLKNTSFKLHGQIVNKVNWKLYYTNGNKTKDGRGLAVTRPPETTWNQKGPTPIYTAYVNYQITPNFELSAQYGHVGGKFSLTPKGGLDTQIINDENNVWHGSFQQYDTVRPSDQYTLKGSNFFHTGSWEHEVKYGFRYKKSTVESLSKWSNSDFYVYSGAYVYLYRERNLSMDATNKNAWASWTALHGPWALNAGISYTDQSGENNPTVIKDDGLCPQCLPGLNYPGSKSAFTWSDASPRLGATYTFDMQKRLLLRANYAQYVDGLGAGDVTYNSPAAAYIYVTQEWADAGIPPNGQVDPGEFSTNCLDAVNSSVDPCNPNGFFDKIDPNYKAPRVQEFILGAEYELAQDFTIGLNAILRDRDRERWFDGNLDGRPVASSGPLYDVNIYAATGQLVPLLSTDYSVTDTLTGTFPNGSPYSEPFYDLNASGLGKTTDARPSFLTNRPGYKQKYQGLEFTATKRLSNRWMLRGFLSYNKWTQDFSGTSGISDPTNYQGGTTQQGGDVAVPSVGSGTKDGVWLGTSTWQFNVNGLYQLPYNMSVSANLYGRQGYGIPYMERSGPKDVQIGEIGDRRYQNLATLDLKFAKLFKLQGATVELSADLFNAANSHIVLSRKVRVDQGANVGAITESLSPRILRFGASVSF